MLIIKQKEINLTKTITKQGELLQRVRQMNFNKYENFR